MITAAITAAIGGVLAFFGVKPGPYLVGVAAAVKVLIVVTTLVFGTRWVRRRDAAAAAAKSAAKGATKTGKETGEDTGTDASPNA
jgi:hypothetical protein